MKRTEEEECIKKYAAEDPHTLSAALIHTERPFVAFIGKFIFLFRHAAPSPLYTTCLLIVDPTLERCDIERTRNKEYEKGKVSSHTLPRRLTHF